MHEPLQTTGGVFPNGLYESSMSEPIFITFKKDKKRKPAVDLNQKILVSTADLMELLDCGKHTAIAIGHAANACVRLDRKLFWNVRLIQKYIDSISA